MRVKALVAAALTFWLIAVLVAAVGAVATSRNLRRPISAPFRHQCRDREGAGFLLIPNGLSGDHKSGRFATRPLASARGTDRLIG